MNILWIILELVWRPIVEISILALGIYTAFLFIRGTRGAPVVTGFLALLLTLTIVTKVLHLTVVTVLLSQFFSVLAIAVVVLFQPELRRILAELGNLPLFNSAREQREKIEDIVKTVDRLAPVHIGALIAIECNQRLAELVEGGVTVDCELTPEMLETIFFPNNAIHDGGVIVRDGRILRAACIFPLTQRQDIPKSVGTRHRAAIGLTEESDAIVVVISEETGSISYTHKGQMIRGISIEELRAFLTANLVKAAPTRSWREKAIQALRKKLPGGQATAAGET
jgi:diadenylate cyclase